MRSVKIALAAELKIECLNRRALENQGGLTIQELFSSAIRPAVAVVSLDDIDLRGRSAGGIRQHLTGDEDFTP
jgi:hypothetical protein